MKSVLLLLNVYSLVTAMWSNATSPRAGTLSVLSDDSFMSAYEDLVSYKPEVLSFLSIFISDIIKFSRIGIFVLNFFSIL